MGESLIGKAEARREIPPVTLNAGRRAESILTRHFDRGARKVEIRPSVGDFAIGAVVFPSQPNIEREPLADPPVVRDVNASFRSSDTGPNQQVILLILILLI